MNIGIIGQGFVGNAVYQKFKLFFEVFTFDINKSLSNSDFDEICKKCEIIFVCVPTPMNVDGTCDTSVVKKILSDLNKISEK